MNVLVLNCGSSSMKFQFLEMEKEELKCKGLVERIGANDAIMTYEVQGQDKLKTVQPIRNHAEALSCCLWLIMSEDRGVIKRKSEIAGIGHRVVHGGEEFSDSVRIGESVLSRIREFCKFAPLHNPHNLVGIEICQELLPGIPQVAVFDTAFHHNMPEKSYIYPIPHELYSKYGIRRYGFHGTSHRYVCCRAEEILKTPLSKLKLITCHLGNGCSIAAVDKGVSVDTTMGYTPLEGLVMGTRCGDIDPAIILYLLDVQKLSTKEVDTILQKKSGLLGLSGTSNDMREIAAQAEKGSARHQLALDVFCHRIRKYIGAYAAEMGGMDAVIFMGGIGENSKLVRKMVCDNMEFLGITVDPALNERNAEIISAGKTKVMVIGTNEELLIARDTRDIIKGEKSAC